MTRASARCVLIVATVGLLAACGSTTKTTGSETPRATVDAGVAEPEPVVHEGPGLLFDVEPAGSEIILDGTTLDMAERPDGFVAVEAGLHQIVVRKDGYKTWRAEVSVRQSAESINVRLEPEAGP